MGLESRKPCWWHHGARAQNLEMSNVLSQGSLGKRLCLGESLSRWASPGDRWTQLKSTSCLFSDCKLCLGSVIPGFPLCGKMVLAQHQCLVCLPFSEPLGMSERFSWHSLFPSCLTWLPPAAFVLWVFLLSDSRYWDKDFNGEIYMEDDLSKSNRLGNVREGERNVS